MYQSLSMLTSQSAIGKGLSRPGMSFVLRSGFPPNRTGRCFGKSTDRSNRSAFSPDHPTAAVMLYKLWTKAFSKHILQHGSMGVGTALAVKTEAQQRGSLHAHILAILFLGGRWVPVHECIIACSKTRGRSPSVPPATFPSMALTHPASQDWVIRQASLRRPQPPHTRQVVRP